MGWVVNATPGPLYLRETDPVPIEQETGWAPGPVWMGAENLAPTGIGTNSQRQKKDAGTQGSTHSPNLICSS
jgi:hypothetical protein